MFQRSDSGSDEGSFQGHRLLLPCISVGNVGQLTVDLIVNSLRMPRVGYLDHPAILPLVGNDAFDHTQPAAFLHTAAEVYHSTELNLLAVQLRTPLIKCLRGDFCLKFLEWVKEVGISEVVVLTSSHAHERRDSQITGDQFRFLLSPLAADNYAHFTEQLHWKLLEGRPTADKSTSEPSSSSSSSSPNEKLDTGVLQEADVFLPGAGLAKRLYRESNLLGVKLVVMVAFCIQGDNVQDAIAMGDRVNAWMDINRKHEGQRWIIPSSWSMMYGGPSPSSLF